MWARKAALGISVLVAACGARSGSDNESEAGSDASIEGAAPGTDAGSDAGGRPGPTGIVYCGSANCAAPSHFCCLYDWPICIVTGVTAGPESCPPGRDQLDCDDATDCPAGTLCCAVDTGMNGYAEAKCVSECRGGMRAQVLCNSQLAQPCPADHPTCADDEQSIFLGKPYCHI